MGSIVIIVFMINIPLYNDNNGADALFESFNDTRSSTKIQKLNYDEPGIISITGNAEFLAIASA
ncbi:MAG: hypothetical protein ACW98A_15565, partial [Candidatus Hodarchaeales archaeon]